MLALLLLSCDPRHLAIPAAVARLSASTTALDVGPATLDSSANAELTLSNLGDVGVEVSVTLDGAGFSLDDPGPWTVGAQGARSIRVRFRPSGGDPVSGALTLSPDPARVFDASPLIVALTGLVEPDADADGHAHLDAGGDDCDDGDATVYPGAAEVWYDGTDQDCDGDDSDQDGDGSPLSEDCDDQDPGAVPGGDDLDLDGVDDDCDGVVDDEAMAALAGRLLLTEYFLESLTLRAPYGQYLELLNGSGQELQPDDWRMEVADEDAPELVLDGPWADGALLLLCASQDAELNGGLDCDGTLRPWPDLDPDEAELTLWAPLRDAAGAEVDAVQIDRVEWTASWPQEPGAAVQLSSALLSATDNDRRLSWCLATTPRETGDLGTPGATNEICP